MHLVGFIIRIYHDARSAERHTNLITQSISWEASSASPSQVIPRIFWNPTVQFSYFRQPANLANLSQMNLVPAIPPTSFKIVLILSYHVR